MTSATFKIASFFLSIVLITSCNIENTHQESQPKTFDERMADKFYPMEGHFMAQNYPEETFAIDAYRGALATVKRNKEEATSRTGQWEQQGPGNIGGRINTIAINPEDDAEMMLGYSFGGVFRTRDNGSNWEPIFDNEDILSISDISYDPNDASVIFVGTGDHNISGYPVTGNGILKSINGGDSWDNVGLREAGVISEISVAKSNSSIVYAASMGLPFERNGDRGLYKSEDHGENWVQVFFLNDSTGVIDIEVHPTNPDIVYAATWTRIRNNRESTLVSDQTGIFKTTDGGENWTRLENGLPQGDLVRPGLAMFEENPDVVYSLFVHNNMDTLCSPGFHLEGVYKTADAGETWSEVPTGEETGLPCSVLGGFGWYFGQIRVHPQNEDELYILGVDLYRTQDGGATWWEAAPPWWTYEVHADKHDLVFNGPNLILATDGGAYRQDPMTAEWTDIENIISTQFYRVAVNTYDGANYFGGAQDNGTTGGREEIVNEWPRIFGGDGFQMVFHPTDPNIWYVETQRGVIRRTINGGGSYQLATNGLEGNRNWDMQYIMSSIDPNVLYTGTDRMYRTISEYETEWIPISGVLTDTVDLSTATSHTISTLDESPVDQNILYCGTSDGLVWRSLDFGDNWEMINDGLPRRYISDIKASKSDAATVYVTIQGYKDNDNTPYIYKSTDNGDTWVHINGDMPQIAINDILLPEEDDDDSEIFVASDGGVYYTKDEGVSWVRLGDDMPIIPVYDLAISIDNKLVAGTFARGIYTFDLEQLEETSTSIIDVQPLTIRPTITADIFQIEHLTYGDKVNIYNQNGYLVKKVQIEHENEAIDISRLASGVYIICSSSGVGKVAKI